ncbi:MAG: ImmA/IrrE family metallo-endopeptidase [bacterium]
MTRNVVPFSPDWVSPPGDTILDLIDERGWTQTELARRLGYSLKHVNQLIKGLVPLSEELAICLELVLGSTARFWLTREAQYREGCIRLESLGNFKNWIPWLEKLPIHELMQYSVIPKRRVDEHSKPGIVEECLRFFGVASPDEWDDHYGAMQGFYRRSRIDQTDIGAISAWLRLGEQQAETVETPKFDRSLFIKTLETIRTFTTLGPEVFEPMMRDLLRRAGVIFALVPAIPRSRVSGVARWLSASRPLVQMSLYGKFNDKFWFTFFHEAAHILLHDNEKKMVYLDDPAKDGFDSPEEHAANGWAAEYLIPEKYEPELIRLNSQPGILSFASKVGIHPGIIVGRLQYHQLIAYSKFNQLKVKFEFGKVK